MSKLATPRQVLSEVVSAANKPWWADRLMARIEKVLTESLHNGKPIIDTPMSSAACEAVLEEALERVRMPGTDPLDDMLRDMHAADDSRKTYVFGSMVGRN